MAREEPKIRIAAQYKKELDLRRLAGVLIELAMRNQEASTPEPGETSPSESEAA